MQVIAIAVRAASIRILHLYMVAIRGWQEVEAAFMFIPLGCIGNDQVVNGLAN
jgi:hypothetical protein